MQARREPELREAEEALVLARAVQPGEEGRTELGRVLQLQARRLRPHRAAHTHRTAHTAHHIPHTAHRATRRARMSVGRPSIRAQKA